MLPNNLREWFVNRSNNRSDDDAQSLIKDYIDCGYNNDEINELIVTTSEAIKILDELEINKKTAFYEFYSKFSGVDSSEQANADLMYSLDDIYEAFKNSFWEEYPQIGKRYFRMSSIEGEWSYFYDKETDALYGVDWDEMDDLIAGKLKPLFTSFYDFLEWYYSEDEE